MLAGSGEVMGREGKGGAIREKSTQQKIAELVGMTQRRVGQIENISNRNISNTYIPDLRYKIQKEVEIVLEAQGN